MGNIKAVIDEKFVLQLLIEYNFFDGNSEEGIKLRNDILTQLIPLIKHVTKKYWASVDIRELYQEVAENALVKNIPDWQPDKGHILGYFNKCFHNHCINVCKKEYLYRQRFPSVDPEDDNFWGNVVDQNSKDISFVTEEKFEGEEQEAYLYCLSTVASDGILNHSKDIKNEIIKQHNLDNKIAERILGNAVITVREANLDKRDTTKPAYEKNSLFGRMAQYLTEEQIGKIIHVFGGIKLRVPKEGEECQKKKS